MREICEGCEADMRLSDSYLAEEDARELEILVWRCPGCGDRHEEAGPVRHAA